MVKSVIISRRQSPCSGPCPVFRNDDEAIAWGVAQRAFTTPATAAAAFGELQARYAGRYRNVWPFWISLVAQRLAGRQPAAPAWMPAQPRLLRV